MALMLSGGVLVWLSACSNSTAFSAGPSRVSARSLSQLPGSESVSPAAAGAPQWPDSLSNEEEAELDSPAVTPGPQQPTEAAFWMALFGTFANGSVPGPIDPGLLYRTSPSAGTVMEQNIEFIFRCAMRHPFFGRHFRSLSPETRRALHVLFVNYLGLLSLEDADAVPVTPLPIWSNSCAPNQWPGNTQTGSQLYYATHRNNLFKFFYYFNSVHGSAPDDVVSFLQTLKSTPGARVSDVYILYLMHAFPLAFGTTDPVLVKTYPPFGDPYSQLINKTTPSLKANNNVLKAISVPVAWKELGMYEYSSWGYGWANSWIAQGAYSHPIVTSLVPFFGPLIDAFDAFENIREGRDANGRPANVKASLGLFALNLAFATLDLPFNSIKAVKAGVKIRLGQLVKRGRTVSTMTEAAELADEAKMIVTTATATDVGGAEVAVGAEAKAAAYALGDPSTYDWRFWIRALEFPELNSQVYSMLANLQTEQVAKYAMEAMTDTTKTWRGYMEVVGGMSKQANLDDEAFGAMRYVGQQQGEILERFTPIAPRGTIGERYWSFLPMLRRYAQRGTHFDAGTAFKSLQMSVTPSPGWMNQVTGTITLPDGTAKQIPLTQIVTLDAPDREGNVAYVWHWNDLWFNKAGPATSIDFLDEVDTYLNTLFRQALDPSKSRDEVIDLIATLQWWECNLTRFKRGSQGGADLAAKALAHVRGIQLGAYKAEVSPDFWAFTHSLDEFKKIYRDLFDKLDGAQAPDLTLQPHPPAPPETQLPLPVRPQYQNWLFGDVTQVALGEAGKAVVTGWGAEPLRAYDQAVDDGPYFAQQADVYDKTGDSAPSVYIQIRKVNADGSETEVVTTAANAPTPDAKGEPDWLAALKKANSGFNVQISVDSCTTYNVYAIDWAFFNVSTRIGSFGSPCVHCASGVDIPKNLNVTGPIDFPYPVSQTKVVTLPLVYYSYPQFWFETPWTNTGFWFSCPTLQRDGTLKWALSWSASVGNDTVASAASTPVITPYSKTLPPSLKFALYCNVTPGCERTVLFPNGTVFTLSAQ